MYVYEYVYLYLYGVFEWVNIIVIELYCTSVQTSYVEVVHPWAVVYTEMFIPCRKAKLSIQVKKSYGLFILDHNITERRENISNRKKSSYIDIWNTQLQKEETEHQSILCNVIFALVLSMKEADYLGFLWSLEEISSTPPAQWLPVIVLDIDYKTCIRRAVFY